MNFDLHKPCNGCPFVRESEVRYLGARRAREIARTMASPQGGTFSCHKTVHHDDDTGEYVRNKGEQHCAGALLLMEKVNSSGTQFVRIMERMGFYDRTKYTGAETVFDTVEEMVESHSNGGVIR
jgi:hypothetical protein